MGGMAAARMADEIGHVGVWARIARVALRVGSAMVEGALVAGAVALALGVSVATFGCGAFILCGLVAGVIGGATGWSDYKEKKIQEMTEDIGELDITGVLGINGASRVFINPRGWPARHGGIRRQRLAHRRQPPPRRGRPCYRACQR